MVQPLKYEFAPLTGTSPGFAPADVKRSRRVTDDEIEEVRAQAFEEGRARGEADAISASERTSAEALDALRGAMRRWIGDFETTRHGLQDGAAALALAIGRAIAGVAVARAPLDVIGPMVAEALDSLADDARVTIEVHEAIVDVVESEVESLTGDNGFSGRVRVRPGADNIADCRVDWGEGGIERCVAAITGEIADRLAAHGVALPPVGARTREA